MKKNRIGVMNYFYLSWNGKSKSGPVAYVEGESRPGYQVAHLIGEEPVLPFAFGIKHVVEGRQGLLVDDKFNNDDAIWVDYLPNQFAWPLFSKKAKSIFLKNLTNQDKVDWIEASVTFQNIAKQYYVLKFTEELNTLDQQKTTFVRGSDAIIKPVFSANKINGRTVFHRPAANSLWKITSGIFISEKLKKDLVKEKCTNIDFSKVTVI